MLRLENIHKYYTLHGKIIKVLSGVDLVLKEGESVAVIGASGVGKSTLLNIMGSLDPPTTGRVDFNGQNMYEMCEKELCRFRNREIGFVFQFHHLLPELNSLENTMMPALIAGLSRKKIVDQAVEVLEKVGLGNRLSHRSGELSGGEQQRVAIARALIMKPVIMIADEPTGNLDWSTGQEIADLLLNINRAERVSMVIATHNLKLAEMMSTCIEIADGQIRSIPNQK